MGEEDRSADPLMAPAPSPSARLQKRRDFLHVAGGRKGHSALFTVQARQRTGLGDGPRVGFTVTKKVGNAVERNRIRRRLREVLRLQADFHLVPSHDYVIVARRPVLSAKFRDIGAGLRMTVAKLHGGSRSGGGRKSRPSRS